MEDHGGLSKIVVLFCFGWYRMRLFVFLVNCGNGLRARIAVMGCWYFLFWLVGYGRGM
jgi:hypothetical protein